MIFEAKLNVVFRIICTFINQVFINLKNLKIWRCFTVASDITKVIENFASELNIKLLGIIKQNINFYSKFLFTLH